MVAARACSIRDRRVPLTYEAKVAALEAVALALETAARLETLGLAKVAARAAGPQGARAQIQEASALLAAPDPLEALHGILAEAEALSGLLLEALHGILAAAPTTRVLQAAYRAARGLEALERGPLSAGVPQALGAVQEALAAVLATSARMGSRCLRQ